MNLFGKKGRDDTFVRMIQVAQEDRTVGDLLRSVLGLAPEKRSAALINMAATLEKRGAPRHFIEALEVLKEDGAAEKALELLK
ncbi:MAG: hypothetical protein HZB23_09040 [Deltaproteobacteria bacterium]|nr:hypothetical protein [Deltaproteobacteria bacterium]